MFQENTVPNKLPLKRLNPAFEAIKNLKYVNICK